MLQVARGYLSAIWKDIITPMGLPMMTLNHESDIDF